MRSAVAVLAAIAFVACAAPTRNAASSPLVLVAATRAPTASIEMALKDGHVVGGPRVFDNLTIFAVSSSTQRDVGPITTLDEALASGRAVVREVEADHEPPLRQRDEEHTANVDASGPQVNTLVIENKGTVPIFVLAGTVVKGGNQDREIGEDFIVSANRTVPVEAFCVEQGRWDANRNGQATQGQFGTMQQLANSEVRGAGQYRHNQGEVWSKVDGVNADNHKTSSSQSLMATLDDNEVARRRGELATKVNAYLQSVTDNTGVVGIAYAVGGKVRGVRWFANHRVFELFRATLVNTAAVDALTAQARGEAPRPSTVLPSAVSEFIAGIDEAKVKEHRATAASNVNDYKETDAGFGSKTTLKPAASREAIDVSADYLSK